MQYISVGELETRFDSVYSFGTYGTCWASVGFGTFQIGRASGFIDSKLMSRYGTCSPIFGTNVWGTSAVPEMIKDCCADLSLAYAFQNKQLSVTETEQKWINMIEKRGLDLLEGMATDTTIELTPYNGTQTPNMMDAPNAFEWIRGESVIFNGTNLIALNYKNVIRDTLRVYGTETFSPKQYKEGVDFVAWYYNEDNTGTRAGYICGTGTTTTPPVIVDYQYRKDNVFKLNDYWKWGFTSPENR